MSECYLFATGGTGGHLMPALTLAGELRAGNPQVRIVFVGSDREVERSILEREGYEHYPLPARSTAVLRRNPLQFLRDNRKAFRIAREIVDRRQPRAVIGCGGFASVPAVYAASRRGVPVMLLEQNAVPGRATSWLARRAAVVCLAFEESRSALPRSVRCVVTGNPVRPDIAELARAPRDGSPPSRPTLLVLGGSQGARIINHAVLDALRGRPEIFKPWHIVHQAGSGEHEALREQYQALKIDADVRPFLDDLPEILGRVDLAVSRAGGTTLAEFACAGIPALLVPDSRSVRDHQRQNARAFVDAGAALTVDETVSSEETASQIVERIRPLLEDCEHRRSMAAAMRTLARPDATGAVLAELARIV